MRRGLVMGGLAIVLLALGAAPGGDPEVPERYISVDEVKALLARHHVRVLDGDAAVVKGVGIAGVKGFAGGFGCGSLGAFGEPVMKAFVQEAVDEALKLENALRAVTAPTRIVLLHYSPIPDTLV